MCGILFKKSGIRLLAILLVLICMPFLLLSFFSHIGDGSIMQDKQTVDINQDSISACDAGKDALRSIAHQNQLVDIFVQETDFSQNTQRLLSYKSLMTIFYGLSYNLFFRATPSYISLPKIPICKIKHFLIAPHSPNAPPFILI